MAEEYLARLELLAILALPLYVCFFVSSYGRIGFVYAAIAMPSTAWLLRWRLAHQANSRLRSIQRRMPFLLDLLTLLMEAGATFLQALAG